MSTKTTKTPAVKTVKLTLAGTSFDAPLAPKATKAAQYVTEKHAEFKLGTIRHAIYKLLTLPASQAMTPTEMAIKLWEQFPTHNPTSLLTSVRAKIVEFPATLKGFKLGRDDAGRYSTNIKGGRNTRN